jgi:hypothetical protein
MLALGRFLDLFDTQNGEAVDIDNILVSAWKSDMFSELEGCDIWSNAYGWTRQMVTALDHLRTLHKIEHLRQDDSKTVNILESIHLIVFMPKLKLIAKARKGAGNRKKMRDAITLKDMPTPDESRAGMLQAMLDMKTIHSIYHVKKNMPLHVQRIANTAMIAVQYINQPGGRSMDWEQMNDGDVKHFLDDDDAIHLETNHYKTYKVYGTMGKWISPGTKVMMQLYSELPWTETDMFLKSTSDSKYVSVASNLRTASRVYLKGKPVKVNLLRKWYHTQIKKKDNEDKVMKIVCSFDKHRQSTGEQHYVTQTPLEDAMAAKVTFEAFFGPPLEFPSDAQCDLERRTLHEIAGDYRKTWTSNTDRP